MEVLETTARRKSQQKLFNVLTEQVGEAQYGEWLQAIDGLTKILKDDEGVVSFLEATAELLHRVISRDIGPYAPIKLSGTSDEEMRRILPPRVHLLGYVGSIAHGTYIPSTDPDSIDDKDIMGVAVGPIRDYLCLYPGGPEIERFDEKRVQRGEWDSVTYEVRKFFFLLMKQNPNVVSLLWLNHQNYIYVSEMGQRILDNRELFVSKAMYHSFIGYAKGQFHRMTHMDFQGYMGKKRKELVERYGFDVKNASHTIRLLRMVVEALGDGVMRVYREDNQELKAIKTGEWSLEKVTEESDRLFKLAEEAYVRSPLPPRPDRHAAEALLTDILREEFLNAETDT